METTLHIFKNSDHTRAIIEGTPVPMACGDAFYFKTVNGRPVLPSGEAICLECLDAVGPKVAALILGERHSNQPERTPGPVSEQHDRQEVSA